METSDGKKNALKKLKDKGADIIVLNHPSEDGCGSTDKVMNMGSLEDKFTAFGFDVLVEKNGNDLNHIIKTLTEAKLRTGKGIPVCILLHTEMGNGVDFMMGSHKWHGVAPNDEELANALSQNEETLGDY